MVMAIWSASKCRYGYRKITAELHNAGEAINHKKVRRIMSKLGIYAMLAGHDKKYSSFRGKVGTVAQNLMKRDFVSPGYMRKAGTDVTEFKFDWGKVYLSPIIDFYNDEILSYSVSTSPNMKMIIDMLDGLYEKHPLTNCLMLQSDQGWQYQMKPYQQSLQSHGIIQSMSRKGNCLDNSKTENFFSILKKEMFYGHENDFHSFEEFREAIDKYIEWFNTKRIVSRLGKAPAACRGIVSIPLLCYSSI